MFWENCIGENYRALNEYKVESRLVGRTQRHDALAGSPGSGRSGSGRLLRTGLKQSEDDRSGLMAVSPVKWLRIGRLGVNSSMINPVNTGSVTAEIYSF
jgi:hypothetical protein